MEQESAAEVAPAERATQKEPIRLEEVLVTGTHIRGVQPSSPVISVTQEQILDAGQTDLGEFARSVPQNFGGGANPGVAQGSTGPANNNYTGASSFNLRGLGPDATLTLLNGRRLAYNGGYNRSISPRFPWPRSTGCTYCWMALRRFTVPTQSAVSSTSSSSAISRG